MNEREKEQIVKERVRITKEMSDSRKLVDPLVKVKFQNMEDPTVPGKMSPPLSFSFNQYRFKESKSQEEPDTALRDGNVYDLPISIIEHLNRLTIPIYGQTLDPITGALKTFVAGQRNRFACVPVDMAAYKQLNKEA